MVGLMPIRSHSIRMLKASQVRSYGRLAHNLTNAMSSRQVTGICALCPPAGGHDRRLWYCETSAVPPAALNEITPATMRL